MLKSDAGAEGRKQSELDELFERASGQWDKGNLKSAFRLFLVGARAGDVGSQVNLGTFYSNGIGVKPNRDMALQWYRRAYRRGDRSAAHNIAIVLRDEKKIPQALNWFERAVKLGDGDANLEIAKILLDQKGDKAKVNHYLKQTCKASANDVTEASREEAQRLLKQLTAT